MFNTTHASPNDYSPIDSTCTAPPLLSEDAILDILLSQDDMGFVENVLKGMVSRGLPWLYSARLRPRLKQLKDHAPGVYLGMLIHELRRMEVSIHDFDRHVYGTTSPPQVTALPPPETLTALLAADIPPPLQLFDGLMHEGLLLFGGKSKRGKSWLMFDLALSLAVGRHGFRHFGCPKPRPVLFLALEDGRARLQGRARSIQSNLTTVDSFHLRYSFPPLADGGCALLAQEIEAHGYGLMVIDVLAKLEHVGKHGDKTYHEVYEMFAPQQQLRQRHPFCLAMLTHLRKQEADDVFDAMMGSVAYQGAQDVLWVLERKPKDDFAFLHIRDKDAEDKTIALRFTKGHWEYVGAGEEYEVTRDQRKVIKVLAEEKREMAVQEILKACEFGEAKYGYLRKLLVAMVQEDLIHRTKRGQYSATMRAAMEMDVHEDDADDDFAAPF